MFVLLLKNRINSLEVKLGTEIYELVRIVFSIILKDCNIMSFTNAAWQGGSPTTRSKHAYWIPNQICEVSIIPAFDKSVAKVLASIKYNNGINYIPVRTNSIKDLLENRANVLLYNAPIGHTVVPESCLDAIIISCIPKTKTFMSVIQSLNLKRLLIEKKDLTEPRANMIMRTIYMKCLRMHIGFSNL